MDASRHLHLQAAAGQTPLGAGRMSLAEDLRTLADEIERGTRLVREMNTFEAVSVGKHPVSILQIMSVKANPISAI